MSDLYKRTCDYQTNGCTAGLPVVFVEYEADVDLCYSLEHDGAIYGWWGSMCDYCREEALSWIRQNSPYRWREVPMIQVSHEPIPDSEGWENIIPDWVHATEYWSHPSLNDWDKPMPISLLFLVYVEDHPDEWALCDTCRQWFWRKEEHNCGKEVEA